MDTEYPLLDKLIEELIIKNNLQICIHDTSGALRNIPTLLIKPVYYAHANPFCILAKRTIVGLKKCYHCKKKSLIKALSLKKTFYGQCYMGRTEIIKPVLLKDKLICVIYLGNFILSSSIELSQNRLQRNSLRIGVQPKNFLLTLPSEKMIISSIELEKYIEYVEIIAHLILLACAQYPKLVKSQDETHPIYRGNTHWAVGWTIDYITTHYDKPFTIEKLSSICFLNPDYLAKLFKKETSQTIVEYSNLVRINRAKNLLLNTQEEIIDIAASCGFNSLSYFCRKFKSITNLSPSEFRKNNCT